MEDGAGCAGVSGLGGVVLCLHGDWCLWQGLDVRGGWLLICRQHAREVGRGGGMQCGLL